MIIGHHDNFGHVSSFVTLLYISYLQSFPHPVDNFLHLKSLLGLALSRMTIHAKVIHKLPFMVVCCPELIHNFIHNQSFSIFFLLCFQSLIIICSSSLVFGMRSAIYRSKTSEVTPWQLSSDIIRRATNTSYRTYKAFSYCLTPTRGPC